MVIRGDVFPSPSALLAAGDGRRTGHRRLLPQPTLAAVRSVRSNQARYSLPKNTAYHL